MNERVMQFRIGMFVIVAGLVLTMLIVWFGESPALFRAQTYVTVHYSEAPGVAEGIPVRKSGIRIGEVASIRFDDRPNQPDGVLVTLALEKKYTIRAGSVPRISRALIGDVSIDMLPGEGPGPLPTSDDPRKSPIIEGAVAPDPSNALAAATEAFQNVKGTLDSIDQAAKGIAGMAAKTKNLDAFLDSIHDAAQNVGGLSEELTKMAKASGTDFPAAIANIRKASESLNATLDEPTRQNLQASLRQLASGTSKLDKILADFQPVARDLGSESGKAPSTNLGQAIFRLNRVTYDLSLLTAQLGDGKGRLNPNGSIQRLVMDAELYENLRLMSSRGAEVMMSAKSVVGNINRFAERIANDPAALTRGALSR